MDTKKSKKMNNKKNFLKEGGYRNVPTSDSSIEVKFNGGAKAKFAIFKKIAKFAEDTIVENGEVLQVDGTESSDYSQSTKSNSGGCGDDVKCYNSARFIFRLYR